MGKQLETERLIMRRFQSEDWKDLYEYLSDKDVVFFEPYDCFTKEEAKKEAERRAGDDAFFAVCLKKSGKVIGNIYFEMGDFDTCEIGYVFNKNYQKHGYATESAKKVMDYGFKEMGVRRIVAMCNPKNENSWKLLERLHMRREGHLLKNIYFKTDEKGNPLWSDTYEYGILKEEWK